MNQDEIRRHLAELIDASDLNMREISTQLGKNSAYMQQYITRSVPKVLPEDVRAGLAKLLEISEDQLRPSTGGQFRAPLSSSRTVLQTAKVQPDVPVMGTVLGGAGGDFTFNGEVMEYLQRPPGLNKSKDVYAVYVRGSSMYPRFKQGELVFVLPGRPASVGDDIIIEMEVGDGEPPCAYIKEFRSETPAAIIAHQYHPDEDLTFERAKIKAIHRVVPIKELFG